MGNRSTRVLAAVAAGAMAGGLGLAGASAPQAARAPGGLAGGAAVRGTQLWVSRYNGPGGADDSAAAVAVGPDGKTVYVTGNSTSANGMTNDYATVAYQAGTGARLWGRRYNSPGNGYNLAAAMAVSPGGGRVFVTGEAATVAYRAANGDRLWASRYHGPGNSGESAVAVVAGPGGKTVFVTGTSFGAVTSHEDWATIAYSAATGAQRWASRHNGPTSSDDRARSLALSPDGKTVYVTGYSSLSVPNDRYPPTEYVTIAYRTTTGARLWARHYQNVAFGQDGAASVAVSPAGTVFVTGSSVSANGDRDYATIAYRG
jgi:hypothetical protein